MSYPGMKGRVRDEVCRTGSLVWGFQHRPPRWMRRGPEERREGRVLSTGQGDEEWDDWKDMIERRQWRSYGTTELHPCYQSVM